MPGRITPLITGNYYHILNRGVENRKIFTQTRDYKRFLQTVDYYRFTGMSAKFSQIPKIELGKTKRKKLVKILCYCLMPNHFHFLIKQVQENGISAFMSQISNSYTKYFNTKYERIGSLFQGTFKAVLIENENQFLHLSRYIHLNPVTSKIVAKSEQYDWSSYKNYIDPETKQTTIVEPQLILGHFQSKHFYQKFVEDHADYATTLETLKHRLLEKP